MQRSIEGSLLLNYSAPTSRSLLALSLKGMFSLLACTATTVFYIGICW